MGDTCNFCATFAKPEHPNRYGYCGQCKRGVSKGTHTLRYRQKNTDPAIRNYMKGVFESFIATVERSPAMFRQRTFDSIKNHVVSYNKYLTMDEMYHLLDTITQFEKRWSKYIDLVLNKSKFMELASSGGLEKDLVTPEDWTAAITNLIWILTQMNDLVEIQLKNYLGPEGTKEKTKMCKERPLRLCAHPCKEVSTLGLKRCTYTGLKK